MPVGLPPAMAAPRLPPSTLPPSRPCFARRTSAPSAYASTPFFASAPASASASASASFFAPFLPPPRMASIQSEAGGEAVARARAAKLAREQAREQARGEQALSLQTSPHSSSTREEQAPSLQPWP